MIRIVNNLYRSLLIVLVLIIVIIVISSIPLPGNFKIFSVASGSMEPKIKTGSLIIVKPEKKYNVNEIITSRTADKNKTLTHRIINIKTINRLAAYETKGDANKIKDSRILPLNDIIGKVIFSLPYLGYPLSFSKTPIGLIILIVVPATIIIYSEILNIKKEILLFLRKKKITGTKNEKNTD